MLGSTPRGHVDEWGDAPKNSMGKSGRTSWTVDLYQSRKHTVKEICELVGISRATLYGYVNEVQRA